MPEKDQTKPNNNKKLNSFIIFANVFNCHHPDIVASLWLQFLCLAFSILFCFVLEQWPWVSLAWPTDRIWKQ